MRRFIPALILALCLHIFLLISRFPHLPTLPPRLTGQESVTISLSPGSSVEKQTETVTKEEQRNTIEKPEKDEAAVETSEKINTHDKQPVVLKKKAVQKIVHSPSVPEQKKAGVQNSARPREESELPAVPILVKASPHYASNPKPEYPALARRRNQQGTVMVSVTVSEKGVPDRVSLHKSSGYPLLDKSALKAVTLWHFLPGTTAGHPVATEVLIPVHFKLH
ncbi:TonB family protein [Desulfocapsa sulfexigens DSM 10523]|uniref:TonB family protein n=1 Tax=Desulfocapsa sulfexigens (strain DSM 10523 / SB164P1) TaxID=1167006 RepID=M1PC57_DESSD|nr:energy transducer TonB [Desulfocapsa sulfexigens]AGF77335.1 TonB family protein [Desulfocapsa sulfexigens DSM 10523]